MGHHLLMGRKTFESIGVPLAGRTSVVLTRQKNYSPPSGHFAVSSLEQALNLVQERGEEELFVCGGADLYCLALERADRLYLTRVEYSGPADTFFPPFEHLDWQASVATEYQASDTTLAWSFQLLQRNR